MVYQKCQKHRSGEPVFFIGPPIKICRCTAKIYWWTDNIIGPPIILSVHRQILSVPDNIIGGPLNFVGEKINSVSEICRDIATFLSNCGEKEFHETLNFLKKNLKTDWQCSQITNIPVTDENKNKTKQKKASPIVGSPVLADFKPENIIKHDQSRMKTHRLKKI